MGAKSPELIGEGTTGGTEESVLQDQGGSNLNSKSNQLVVYLPADLETDGTYHTSRLCSEYPTEATAVSRNEAEDAGHDFCWTCFELEMLALHE